MGVKPVIYQLVVRYFGNTNTTNQVNGSLALNGCGKFNDINAHALRAIREMGVTHLWLTGCLRQATLTDWDTLGLPPDDADVVKGIAGSFYAIRDYFDVCPDYAENSVERLAEFTALIHRVHHAGMKVLIDFVPNHVARGYHSVVRPELDFGLDDDRSRFFAATNHYYYIIDQPGEPLRLSRPAHWNPPGVTFDGLYPAEDGSPQRPVRVTGNNCLATKLGLDSWYETVKLNYGYNFVTQTAEYQPQPPIWMLMDEVLAYWQAMGVDGFRCDFAHFVPAPAWEFLITRAKQRDAGITFIAEAYPWEGSGDPITNRQQLIDVGMAAVYNDGSYHLLKKIYLGQSGQDDYDRAMRSLSPVARRGMVQYVENHDERRIASSVDPTADWSGNSGFGSAEAGYLIAPLQYLCGPGPVLMLNGQELGERGADAEGYSGNDGRTTVFDYWCMPEFVKWVNGHTYNGRGLSQWQVQLRAFYAALLALCQDPAVQSDGYWGLKSFNCPEIHSDCPAALYTFARFEEQSGRLLLVVGNFDLERPSSGRIRVPQELADLSGLAGELSVHLRLDRHGEHDQRILTVGRADLVGSGLDVLIPPQTVHVYDVRSSDYANGSSAQTPG